MKTIKITLLMFLLLVVAFAKANTTYSKINQDTLIIHCKPLYDSFGKANVMRVSYQVPFEHSLDRHSLDLFIYLMQILGRKTNLISIFTTFDKKLSFKVKRNGKIRSFSYIPRRGSIEAWKWKASSG